MKGSVIENTPFKTCQICRCVMPKFIGERRFPDKNIVVGLIVPTNSYGMHVDDPPFDFISFVAVQAWDVEMVVIRRLCE